MPKLNLKCKLTGKISISQEVPAWQCQQQSNRMRRWHREKREQLAAAMNAIAEKHRFLPASPLGLSSLYNLQKNVKPICSKDSSNLSNDIDSENISNSLPDSNQCPGGSQDYIDSKNIESLNIDSLNINNNSLNNYTLNNKVLNNSNDNSLTNNDLTLKSNSLNNQDNNNSNNNSLDINYRAPRKYNNDGTVTTNNNLVSIKGKRQPKQLSSNARNLVQSSCIMLERKYGKHKLTFATLTMPDMDEEDRVNVIMNWGQIKHNYFDSIKYYIKQQGVKGEIISVTEINPKALDRGEIKYHEHVVFRNKVNNGDDWIITPKLSDKLWQAAIDKHTSKSYPVKANRLERIKKSCAAYMSKYMAKGDDIYNKVAAIGQQHLLPHSWYYGTQSLKREVRQWEKDNTYEIEYTSLSQLKADLKASDKRKRIEGIINKDPYEFYAPWDEELLLALIIYFNPKYADTMGINLITAMLQWEQERQEEYYVRAG